MKKVLITGIDSFTGIYLEKNLINAGYDVYGTSYSKENGNILKCDITNKNDIKRVLNSVKPNFIVHFAGISFPAHKNIEDFYKANVIGSINLLDVLLELELFPTKILLISSAIVYGNQGLEVLDESLCPSPSNHYGASKLAMEFLAKSYFNKLNIIIPRAFNYTGNGQAEHFLIPKIVKHYKENKSVIELGNIDVSREFNDVEYVCEVYKRLLECKDKNLIVNMCSGRGLKLLNVIEMMNDLAGYKIIVKINPNFVREGEIKSLTGSPSKLFNVIGKVVQKDFKQTLKEMLEA